MTIKKFKTIYFIYNADGGLLNEIKYWINKNLLKKNGIILIHREKKNLDIFPKNFKILINKIYGRSNIIFGKFD